MLHDIEYKGLKIKGNLFAAPLAGYTDFPTRLVLQENGEDLSFTEMVSADGLVHRDEKTLHLLDTDEREKAKAAQIFGNDPGILKEAVEYIRDRTDYRIVNINCGCPVKKILKSGKGGFLLREEALLHRILLRLRDISGIFITLKIRAGWDREHLNYLKVGHWAEENNISLIIFHPRTVLEGFKGRADWDLIGDLKKKIGLPVIGNGDIRTAREALERLEHYGTDGLMIGRAFLGNPWIFREIKRTADGEKSREPDERTRIASMLHHLKMMTGHFGEKKGVITFRKQMLHYIRDFEKSARLRSHLQTLETMTAVERICEEFLKEAEERKKSCGNN
jgi:tRNA-dihydrouridine synthase B